MLKPIEKAQDLKARYHAGQFTYEEVTAKLKPVLAEMDKEAERIAKKFGRKHHKFSVIGYLRTSIT